MRVLVDTSVWSLSFRKRGPADHPAVRRLGLYLQEDRHVVLTGLILQEILQAFRSDTAFRRLVDYLEGFPLLEMPRANYVAAAELHRRCASRGISTSTADCQIAASALAHDCALLTTDTDFQRIAEVCQLDLVDYSAD